MESIKSRKADRLQKLFLTTIIVSYVVGCCWGAFAPSLDFETELLFAISLISIFLILTKLVYIRARRDGDNYIRLPILVSAIMTIILIQYRFIFIA
ncbi:hypothetical protein [Ferrimonas lipolytica]|uniref:Uncharacterized protein n=1 Tax=Ferrimonas lipolytica TaxID=2724191 RepID=A0A6H1UEM7_9GAMM|nr:hypothetical protein [Ferrimonas lipolytica]QIZ76793.1 hypothetical protein HER31_07835 [Ferrimonas lipolytica]